MMSLPLIATPLFGIGATEAVVIGLVVLVLFGATRLPKLGKGIGEGIRNFRSSIKGHAETLPENSDADETPKG
jgi:sec-independent protein translocase protein TatA